MLQIQLDVEVCRKEMAIELLLNSGMFTYVNIYIINYRYACVLLFMQNHWKMYADAVAQMKIANGYACMATYKASISCMHDSYIYSHTTITIIIVQNICRAKHLRFSWFFLEMHI